VVCAFVDLDDGSAKPQIKSSPGHDYVQELNDKRLTLVEGSALSERDLVKTRAHSAAAILLLADRFSTSAHQEDLGLQFQVQ
jgi:hypothetical protein